MRPSAVVLVLVLGGACGEQDPGGSAGSSGEASSGSGTSTTGDDPTGAGPTSAAPTSDDPTGAGPTSDGPTGPMPTTTGDEASSDPGTTTTATTTGDTTTGDTTDGESSGGVVCAPASLGPGEHTVEVMHDGKLRSALVHIPASADLESPVPLVLNFHGFSSNADQQIAFSAMNPKADAEGFVVAYPQGIDSSWNAGACCGNAAAQNIDDVGFVRALVASLSEQLCIDPRRVYATGMSNGGFMSHRLACEAADLFAAVAPVSAVIGMPECKPSRPVPILMFNGTADILVAYEGGGNFDKGAVETFEQWADQDGCTGAPVAGPAKGAASCQTHDACDDGVTVTLCTFEGMGHCWPGQAFCPFGAGSTDISANDEMWKLFSAYQLP